MGLLCNREPINLEKLSTPRGVACSSGEALQHVSHRRVIPPPTAWRRDLPLIQFTGDLCHGEGAALPWWPYQLGPDSHPPFSAFTAGPMLGRVLINRD
jgi:hypothetical protein